SEDQTAKIKEVTDSLRPQGGGGGGTNFRDLTEEQRNELLAAGRKSGEATTKNTADLLAADQNTRLKQLHLWQQASRAHTNNDDVSKELSLTDDQKSALKTISDESAKKGQELGRGAGRGASDEERTKVREQMAALRSETEAECMAVLTDDQKAKFTAMK